MGRWVLAVLLAGRLCAPAAALDLGGFFGRDAAPAEVPSVKGRPSARGGCAQPGPAPADRAGLERALLAAIQSEGVSPAARAEAERLLSRLLAAMPRPVLDNLFKARVTLVLVPGDRHILDMPQARALVEQLGSGGIETTVDGRRWREVTNFSNIEQPCGGWAWFLNERSVLGTLPKDNRKGYTLVHEFAHMVEHHGLSAAEKTALERLHGGYRAVAAIERPMTHELYWPFAEMYGVQRKEFFPQMTNVWLDAYQIGPGHKESRAPAWFDLVPAWLPRGPAFTAQERYPRETFTGNLDDILGPSRRHEPLRAFLRSVWGESRSVL